MQEVDQGELGIVTDIFCVTIFAPSGCGKSQLAKATAEQLGTDLATRVPTDYFFMPRPAAMPMAKFDCLPLRYDWALIASLLALPIGTQVSTPDAEFTTFTRQADSGGRAFVIRPVMLFDAMVPYPNADLFVRVDVPGSVRLERIQDRDIRWGSNVAQRTGHLDATWKSAQSHSIVPDLVIDGMMPLTENAALLAAFIREWLGMG